MNIAKKWNVFDSILYSVEEKCNKVAKAVKDSREEEPDAETMIEAETAHLKQENEQLRKREYLHRVKVKIGNDSDAGNICKYYITCPCCGINMAAYLYLGRLSEDNYRPKYCMECGNRITGFPKLRKLEVITRNLS